MERITFQEAARNPLLHLFTFGLGAIAANATSLSDWLRQLYGEVSLEALQQPHVFVPILLLVISIASIIAMLSSADQPARSRRIRNVARQEDDVSAGGRSGSDAGVETSRKQLEAQLRDILSFVSTYLEKNDAHASTMTKAQNDLAAAETLEQVRSVVELLVVRNAEVASEARQLRTSLKDSQARLSELCESLSEARTLALIDPLTTVTNRRGFDDFLESAVETSHATGTPLCLIMTDIDRFKAINDTYGHPTGDAVLKQFAQLITRNVRSTDLVARYGGEEFGLVLPRTSMGSAFEIAERLREKLQSTTFYHANGATPLNRVTASFGVAAVQEGEGSKGLIERSDRKLYEAKINGRNRVAVDSLASA